MTLGNLGAVLSTPFKLACAKALTPSAANKAGPWSLKTPLALGVLKRSGDSRTLGPRRCLKLPCTFKSIQAKADPLRSCFGGKTVAFQKPKPYNGPAQDVKVLWSELLLLRTRHALIQMPRRMCQFCCSLSW